MASAENDIGDTGVLKCILEATVVTGFEGVAKDECREKLAVNARIERGRIFFEIETTRAHEALKLRGIDNILVVVKEINHFNLANAKEDVFSQLKKLPSEVEWLPSLTVWKDLTKFKMPVEDIVKYMGFEHPTTISDETEEDLSSKEKRENTVKGSIETDSETKENVDIKETSESAIDVPDTHSTANDSETIKNIDTEEIRQSTIKDSEMHNTAKDSTRNEETNKTIKQKPNDNSVMPRFRVTCNRSGKKHCFSSQEAACHFGGAVQDYFQWCVDMKNHDIEVVLAINEQRVYISLTVTKESLHKRNLDQFGPTSLRSTIAHNMLRMCSIRCGDVVCDPMCGGGSLPIEGKLSWPSAHFICGDNHDLAWARTLHNLSVLSLNSSSSESLKSAIDVHKWDARNLPLKDNSVDIIVTDLPFGKRMGTRTDNRTLYPQILREMARVCRQGKGRAVLLTQDRQSLTKAVSSQSRIWWQKRVLAVNIGGLAASVYVLQRTNYNQYKTYPRPPPDRTFPDKPPVPETESQEETTQV